MKPLLKSLAPANKSRYVIPFRDDVNFFFSDIKIIRIELRSCKIT